MKNQQPTNSTALPAVAQNGSWWWHKAPPPPETTNSWSSSDHQALQPTLRWCHLSKEINDYTFPEVVSNGFRSVSRYFANVWLYNLDKSHQISSQSHPIKSFALVIIQSDLSYASKPITKTHTQIMNTQMISKHCSATFSFSNGPKPPMTPLQKKSTPFLPWLWPSAFDLQVEPFARKAADWKAPISTKSPVFLRLETPKVLGPGQKDGEKNKRLLRGMPASWENSA